MDDVAPHLTHRQLPRSFSGGIEGTDKVRGIIERWRGGVERLDCDIRGRRHPVLLLEIGNPGLGDRCCQIGRGLGLGNLIVAKVDRPRHNRHRGVGGDRRVNECLVPGGDGDAGLINDQPRLNPRTGLPCRRTERADGPGAIPIVDPIGVGGSRQGVEERPDGGG